jgi:hypothetical protein
VDDEKLNVEKNDLAISAKVRINIATFVSSEN